MKKFTSIFLCLIALMPAAWSQLCTPDTTHFTSGSYVYPAVLPCIHAGTAYSNAISIKIPDSVDAHLFSNLIPAGTSYLHIDSIKFDSITGMPSGIAATNNPAAGVWMYGGTYACATFAGTSAATAGSYPLAVFGRGCVHGTIVFGSSSFPIDTCISGDLSNFFSYTLDVCSTTSACVVDTAGLASSNVAPATLPCIIVGQAFSGTVSIKVPARFLGNQATIDSIMFTGISGLPSGISAFSNPQYGTWLKPGDFACATFAGTTTTAGAGRYNLTFTGTGCGHISFGGNTYDSCFQNFNFAQAYPYHVNVCYAAGIANLSADMTLSIFPNPNQGSFNVTISTLDHFSGEMTVVDVLGRTIHSANLDMTAGSHQVPLTLRSAAPGVYSLVINANGRRSIRQFIVE